MSFIKVMPLLLTVVSPLVMMSGVARAGENPIVLAQAQQQQHKEDEHKQPHGQQPQQHAPQPQPHGGQPQPHAAPQPHAEQPKPQPHAEQPKPQPHAEQPKPQPHAEQPKPQPHAEQPKPQPHAEQARPQPHAEQPKPQPHAGQPQPHGQQARNPVAPPRHEPSVEEKKAKVTRDAHAADRARLADRQRQMAAQEKNPAAIAERHRVETERLRVIASQRKQVVDAHGQTVITEPGNRTIIQVGGRAFIRVDESVNFRLYGGTPQMRRAPNGNAITTIVSPGGVRIEVEVDSFGRPLRRVRYMPDGRRFVLFENRPIAVGVGFTLGAFAVTIDPPRIVIPREQYIVDVAAASEDDVYGALQAGPVEPLDRGYSLDEVLANVNLRDRMRSVNIDAITFDFGSSDVPSDQAVMLETVAAVMRDMANQNPGEVFLVEGHTDAVGSDVDNLSLSDRRAQAVADVLAQQFGVPRENIVTQGYGKQFLLIDTPEPERRNRRVVVRRITPLLGAGDQASADTGPGPQDQQ